MKNLTNNMILLLFAGATTLSAFLAYCAFLKIEKNSSFILVLILPCAFQLFSSLALLKSLLKENKLLCFFYRRGVFFAPLFFCFNYNYLQLFFLSKKTHSQF